MQLYFFAVERLAVLVLIIKAEASAMSKFGVTCQKTMIRFSGRIIYLTNTKNIDESCKMSKLQKRFCLLYGQNLVNFMLNPPFKSEHLKQCLI